MSVNINESTVNVWLLLLRGSTLTNIVTNNITGTMMVDVVVDIVVLIVIGVMYCRTVVPWSCVQNA